MSFGALVAKEVRDVVRERRIFYYILGISILTTTAFFILTLQSHNPPSPRSYTDLFHFLGPLFVGFLALTMAGDAVARERQNRTLHLLFTSPVTKGRLLGASLLGHVAGFLVLTAVLAAFSLVVGLVAGWAAVKIVVLYAFLAFLPAFLALDLLFVAIGSQLRNGRAALVSAAAIVILLWISSTVGPFGWAVGRLAWWPTVSAVHPFDVMARTTTAVVDRGVVAWGQIVRNLGLSVVTGLLAALGLRRMEVGL